MDTKCPVCAYSTNLLTLLHIHCINAHPKEFFTCPWCTVPYGSLRLLQRHAAHCSKSDKNEPREGDINTVLVNGEKCLVCEGQFGSNDAAVKHYKEQHLHFSYICNVCELYFQRSSSLDMHYATSHPISKVMTTESRNSTAANTRASMRDSQNGKNKRSASIAFKENVSNRGAAIQGPTAKKRAVAKLSPAEKLTLIRRFNEKHCIECQIDFTSTQLIADHFKTEHLFDIILCKICSLGFTSESGFIKHMKNAHKNAEPIRVKSNPKKKNRVIQEKRTLEKLSKGEKLKINRAFNEKYCSLCEIDFASTQLVADHFKIEHLFDIILCEICSLGFTSESGFIKHTKNAHTSFEAANSSLKAKKERNVFRSVIAELSNNEKRALIRHFNEKHCAECDIVFASTQSIVSHFKTEHLSEILLCEICGNGFTNPQSRLVHMKTQHNLNENKKRKGSEMDDEPKEAENYQRDRSARRTKNVHDKSFGPKNIFGCHLCSYETDSHEMIRAHITGTHKQVPIYNVKLERVSDETKLFVGDDVRFAEFNDSSKSNNNYFETESRLGRLIGSYDLTLDD